jgi:outer membrane PBP1 activator LpoA protein
MSSPTALLSRRAILNAAPLLLAATLAGCAGGPGRPGPGPGVTSRGAPPAGYMPGERVAVLLPQTGRFAAAAGAVRAGMLAAEQAQDPGQRPALRFFDSSDDQNAAALVRQAAAQGARLVIGPLQKQAVDQLAAAPSLPVTTLALNVASGTHLPPPQLYQFALSPEDEAAAVANDAWAKGYRRVLMLYPDGPWGGRLARAFREKWAKLGGRIVDGEVYDPTADNFSQPIQRLLSMDGVRQGQRPGEQFIFLVATAPKAREIWPQIQQAAGSYVPPVFCTSHIHSSQFDPQGDQDLAGLYFVDIPWLIAPSPDEPVLRRNLERKLSQVRGSYARLYAMGVDAYRLAPRLAYMARHPSATLKGETGTLRLDPLRRVRRDLPLARMTPSGPVLVSGKTTPDGVSSHESTARARPPHLAAATP